MSVFFRQEIKSKAKRWCIAFICYTFYSTGQQLGTFITIIILLLIPGESLSPQSVFAMMFLNRILSKGLAWALPTAVCLVTNIYSSLQRMQNVLGRNNWESHRETSINAEGTKKAERNTKPTFPSTPSLKIHDVTGTIVPIITSSELNSKNVPLLHYITLNVSGPGLVLITGSVGSGKSSLLACVLGGELLVTNGIVEHTGSLAYVSDTPWTFPGTIRENILFGLPYEKEWYLQTVEACQLKKDFKVFPQGDLSRLGEHGATVSGGQRTRIALARAVYSKADILLLDDPLSSLDANVAELVFNECLRGLLADRIVLLTTRTTDYLREADYIVKLKRGVIVAQGNFELMQEEFSDAKPRENHRNVVSAVGHLKIDRHNSLDKMEQNETTGEVLREAEEDREVGNISMKIYWEYFVSGISIFILLFMVLVFISGQGKIICILLCSTLQAVNVSALLAHCCLVSIKLGRWALLIGNPAR